ncbi:NINE protein [Ornithinimicrobium sp. LYQ121]|uniref:NINE protein n=1 Tax=Ornithinimicrobium sp. LYQ121 TaxID=3378801 RepID=UPI003851C4EB
MSYPPPPPSGPAYGNEALYYTRKTSADIEAGQKHKSKPMAYLLWFFLWGFGADRWYVKQWYIAIIPLILWFVIWRSVLGFFGGTEEDDAAAGVAVILLWMASGLYFIVDALFLARSVERYNAKVTNEVRARHGV